MHAWHRMHSTCNITHLGHTCQVVLRCLQGFCELVLLPRALVSSASPSSNRLDAIEEEATHELAGDA